MPTFTLVASPEMKPRKFGLFSVADVKNMEGREAGGIEWFNDSMDFNIGVVTNDMCIGQVARNKSDDNHGTYTATTFQVYSYIECAGINEYKDIQKRAIKMLDIGLERAVEYKLNLLLSTDGNAFDFSPTATPSINTGLAVLESYMDQSYAGVPTFGTSRIGASHMSSIGDTVDIHGNQLQTSLGSPLFGSSALVTGPSGVAAPAGTQWLWVMGNVTVRKGPMFVSEPLFVQSAGVNEAQTVTITGVPTGGSFTLTFDGQTTAAIAWNADAAAVQAALVALSNIDTGDVVVTGTNPAFTVTFGGQYGTEDVPVMTRTASLTGGTAPNVTIATSVAGANNFGDNSYRVMAARNMIVDYDGFAAASKISIPA